MLLESSGSSGMLNSSPAAFTGCDFKFCAFTLHISVIPVHLAEARFPVAHRTLLCQYFCLLIHCPRQETMNRVYQDLVR